MLDLILIVMLIISISKPDVLLAKKMREEATEEQKTVLVKNLRKIYIFFIAIMESLALTRYNEIVGIVLAITFLVLFFVLGLPAVKQNSKIVKEVKEKGKIVKEEKKKV